MRAFMVLAVFGIMGALGYYLGHQHQEWPYRYQTTTPINAPKPGEFLELLVEVDRTMECPNKFYREIRDGRGAIIDQFAWAQGAKPVKQESYIISIPIPAHAVPGHAKYCYAQEPECNWVQYALPNWTKMRCSSFEITKP